MDSVFTLRDALAIVKYGDLQCLRLAKTCADEDGIKAVCEEGVEGDIIAHMGITMDDDTHFFDIANLSGHDLLWQTVLWNTIAQHAATLCLHLENLNGKTHTRQVGAS